MGRVARRSSSDGRWLVGEAELAGAGAGAGAGHNEFKGARRLSTVAMASRDRLMKKSRSCVPPATAESAASKTAPTFPCKDDRQSGNGHDEYARATPERSTRASLSSPKNAICATATASWRRRYNRSLPGSGHAIRRDQILTEGPSLDVPTSRLWRSRWRCELAHRARKMRALSGPSGLIKLRWR